MKRSFSTMVADKETKRESSKGTPLSCSFQILGAFAKGTAKDKNFVFSPCSIQLAISLIANGAKGSTLQELIKFLGSENQDQLKSHASNLISSLTESNSEEGPKLSFVGGVWVDRSKDLIPNFKTDAENIYKAKAESVDFRKNAKEIMETVNQLAAESTNGLIDSLLPENAIKEHTRAVLANALYFKGIWSSPFEEDLTSDFPFFVLEGSSVIVPYMSNYGPSQYMKVFDDLKVLRLPYTESSLSMYILLPEASDGLWPILEKICSEPKLVEEYMNPCMSMINVGMFLVPKFKIDCKFEASEVLQTIGLELCFSDDAEFTGMVEGGGLKVEKVYHGSRIEVEEEGTKAAASAAVDMEICWGSWSPKKDVDFVADHPFVYIVRDDHNGMILFMGYVVNPLLK